MTSSDDLSCKSFTELVTDYLEDRLPATLRRDVEEHFKICPGCVNYLEQMRQTVQLVGSLGEESVPDETREKLLKKFRDWKKHGA
ncbi:MAG: anti-sigma factor family protein [Planctomycetota bacterium]